MKTKRPVTSAQEIVADNRPPIPSAWRHQYDRLLQLRDKIMADANDLSEESNETLQLPNLTTSDSATDRFDRELALSLLSFEQDALGEIDAALGRLQNGTYGVCEVSGKLIPRERLEAIPWARYTVEVQAELEKSDNAADARSLRTSMN